MKRRLFASVLALVLALGAAPSAAAEEAWLIPRLRDYGAFTDTAGTICEDAAALCCETGLMDGVTSRRFHPSAGLTNAQIIVVAARLHERLSGGDLRYFDSVSLTGAGWWTPYDEYLAAQVPLLSSAGWYGAMKENVTGSCTRERFLRLLAAVLDAAGTALPEINAVTAVPDCDDQTLLRFYRWGVLGGKDAYGTLEGEAGLTRAAAAAMLARLIDPAARLTLDLKEFDLCRELLDVAPETPLMLLNGQEITAELFIPTFAAVLYDYNHSHFAAMMLEQNGGSEAEVAVRETAKLVLCETLARELGLDVPPSGEDYLPGYRGLTARGQAWRAHHLRLSSAVEEALGPTPFPADRLPQAEFAEVWETLDLTGASARLRFLPCWGGTW